MADDDKNPLAEMMFKKAQELAVEIVEKIAKSDDSTNAVGTVLLSAMTVGFLLGSSASTAAEMTGVEGLNQWLSTAFASAGMFFSKGKLSVRFAFEITEEPPNPSS
jgi:hypothetical protein